jgi:uncharacterized membrane-anchored protein YhcB (DUF1043 family)
MAGAETIARNHTQKMQKRLNDTITDLRQDLEQVEEPKLKAMFETSAEVLGGLVKAFKDYEQKNETAWRDERPAPSK